MGTATGVISNEQDLLSVEENCVNDKDDCMFSYATNYTIEDTHT